MDRDHFITLTFPDAPLLTPDEMRFLEAARDLIEAEVTERINNLVAFGCTDGNT